MNIEAMPVLETNPSVLESGSTWVIIEPVVDFVVHEDDVSGSSHLVNIPTFILTALGI